MFAWYWIPTCLLVGMCLGAMVMCLCVVAKDSDERIRNIKY